MEKDFELALALDDVLLVPQYSKIITRKLVDLKTKFSRRLELNIPIISANMDTVTESAMAIVMARAGGLGVIHRFMTIDQQVDEVKIVKRAETLVVVDPITISKKASLKQLLELMQKNNVHGILVVDDSNKLEGIVTARDVRFQDDPKVLVEDIMTPRAKLVTASPDVKKEDVFKIFNKYKVEKLPLIDKKDRVQGLITAADFFKLNQNRKAAKDNRGRLLVAAAIGVRDGEERGARLIKAGADALVIDIAHGHHQTVINLLRLLKNKHREVDIIAGNVATAEAAEDLIKAGADAIKVGIGPGRACSTRVVSGAGMPQFSAIYKCSRIGWQHQVPIIADGGIKNSGDLAKVIGAGASSAMIGSLLAGSKESPGNYFIEDGIAYKIYRGLASLEASLDRSIVEQNLERKDRLAEGISTKVAYQGDVAIILQSLIDGLQSGMSYSGSDNIKEFWKKANFVRVTSAGFGEGLPRR